MCEKCGCGSEIVDSDSHGHAHEHVHGVIEARQSVLEQNDRLAEQNRGYFRALGICAVNLLSAPGSGKTALLERTLRDLGKKHRTAVIVGDLQTENDAERIRRAGAPAVQITTGDACHLDAHMVSHAMEKLDLSGTKLLFLENVGNLVCPAMFDLGESARVVLLSVTEGEDKPLKYPVMFRDAHAVVITKTDLAAATGFDRETTLANIRLTAPRATILEVSSRTGEGMPGWYAFLESLLSHGRT